MQQVIRIEMKRGEAFARRAIEPRYIGHALAGAFLAVLICAVLWSLT